LRERLQESFLRGLFGLTAIAKETKRDMKNSRAVASNNFSEGRFIFSACATRQFEFGRLFVTVRQKRSSIGFGGALEWHRLQSVVFPTFTD
jgi:hypothetical protein